MQQVSIFEIIKQVITSWQVIVITIIILLYIQIISHVSKSYHPPKASKKEKSPNKKQAKPEPTDTGPEEVNSGGDSNEELGLEEMEQK